MLCRSCEHEFSVILACHQTDLCKQCWKIEIPLIKEKIKKCGICLSSLKTVQKITTTPCKHAFCFECFLHWGAHYCGEDNEPIKIPCPSCQTIIIPT